MNKPRTRLPVEYS